MSKILLVGYQSDSLQEMYNLLSSSKLYQIIRAHSNEQMIQRLASQSISLTILDQDILNLEKMRQAQNLRASGYGTPILLVSKAISHQAKEASRKMRRVVLLEKPFQNKEFLGITNKLVSGRDVSLQEHRRFFTNQTAILEQVGSHLQYATQIKNLSRGGALLEIAHTDQVDIRGVVRMNIVLDEIQKAYEVNARVIWNSKRDSTGTREVGVEFIQAKDIYRNLLNNL